LVDTLAKFTKEAEMMVHSMVLITKCNTELQAANEAASCRKSQKRKRIQQEETLTVEEGIQMTAATIHQTTHQTRLATYTSNDTTLYLRYYKRRAWKRLG
jgi:hypothetical protein